MITNTSIGSYGRLGNQLFQFSAIFSLSKLRQTEIWLPTESEYKTTVGRFNPVINKCDEYTNDLFKLFDLSSVKKMTMHEINVRCKNFYDEPDSVRCYNEFWDIPDDANIRGYFQCKNYIKPFEEELRNELLLSKIFYRFGKDFIEKLKKAYEKVVSVHIRRGDGLMDHNMYAADLSIENYYKKIITENADANDIVLFFSDDIDWCKKVFFDERYIFVDNRHMKDSHLYDFSLMSMCDVNITAVSTFSWWAGWLNPLKHNKKVIIPKKWWGTSLQHNDDTVYHWDGWEIKENI